MPAPLQHLRCKCNLKHSISHPQCVEDAPFGRSCGRITTKARRLLLTAVCSRVKINYFRVILDWAIKNELTVLKWAQYLVILSHLHTASPASGVLKAVNAHTSGGICFRCNRLTLRLDTNAGRCWSWPLHLYADAGLWGRIGSSI